MNIVLQLIGRIMYLVLGVALIGAMNAQARELPDCMEHLEKSVEMKGVPFYEKSIPGDGIFFAWKDIQRIYYVQGGPSDSLGVDGQKGWTVVGKCGTKIPAENKTILYFIAERPAPNVE